MNYQCERCGEVPAGCCGHVEHLFAFLGVVNMKDAKQSITGLRERVKFTEDFESLQFRHGQLREACAKENDEICQTLGKVLGYPWYKDDQANFPGATEASGVCVGEHVAASLAAETATTVVKLRDALHHWLKRVQLRELFDCELKQFREDSKLTRR